MHKVLVNCLVKFAQEKSVVHPENSVRGRAGARVVVLTMFTFLFNFLFSHQGISQRAILTFLEKQLDPRGVDTSISKETKS